MSTVYPSHADYDLAVKYLDRFVFDPILRAGTVRSRSGVAVKLGGQPLSFPGGFAKVYIVDSGGRTYALRVWLHEVQDAAERYRIAGEFLRPLKLPFFVEFEFVPRCILVNGQRFPVLRMEWVQGYALREFIRLHRDQPAVMESAADAFAHMVTNLHRSGINHGDLQADNVVVQVRNGIVNYKLIDYDTLSVPKLLGRPVPSVGLGSYQHPRRLESDTATQKDDFFSELVIYLTLKAVSEDPTLWDRFPVGGRDKELLFQAADFSAARPTPLFRQLHGIGGAVQKLTSVLWNFTRCPNIALLIPLETVLHLITRQTQSAAAGSVSRVETRFDRLIKSKLAGGGGFAAPLPEDWLDDRVFRSRKSRKKAGASSTAASVTAPSSNVSLSFKEIVAGLSNASQATARPSPVPQSTAVPRRLLVTALVVGGIVVLVALWIPGNDPKREFVTPAPTPIVFRSSPAPVSPAVAVVPTPAVSPNRDMTRSAAADEDWQALIRELKERAAAQAASPASTPPAMPAPTSSVAATPAETAVSAASYRIVNVRSNDSLNVRSGPGADYDVIVQLLPDTRGIRLEQGRYMNGDTVWQEIQVFGYRGYVNEIYLELDQ